MGSGRADAGPASALEAGRRLFARPCAFLAAASGPESLPPPGLPELAFAGRSNVGKSSLLNALTSRQALARTSRDPGRTQTLNFFDLGGRLVLVDMPGYGYARVSKSKAAGWGELVRLYLEGRPTLRRALVLVDPRRGLMDSDRRIIALLDRAAVSYQVVLTKVDTIVGARLDERMREIAAELAAHLAAHPDIIATSALTGAGIPELRAAAAALAAGSALG
ncbi:MAG: ribosome biogenesis GTP-binding protein YihA/YsxC [Pseudomonadota bacterium]